MSEEVKSPFGYDHPTKMEGMVFREVNFITAPGRATTSSMLGVVLDEKVSDEDLIQAIATDPHLAPVLGFYRGHHITISYEVDDITYSTFDRRDRPITYVMDGDIVERDTGKGRIDQVVHFNGQDFPFNPNRGDKLIRPSELQ